MTRKGRPPIGEQAMTATERDRRRRAAQKLPWWQRTKSRQKADIEAAVRDFLALDRDLTDREMYFLAEALNAVARGTFGIALQAILDAHEPESSFSPQFEVPDNYMKSINRDVLVRALWHSEQCPVQETPIFR
ncbi:MAG: hypothetical protein MUE84_12270 [Hyphomonas sp.]|jgi:hypothetical protein|nr:hypothetical protein [Hyphomonas sp.]